MNHQAALNPNEPPVSSGKMFNYYVSENNTPYSFSLH